MRKEMFLDILLGVAICLGIISLCVGFYKLGSGKNFEVYDIVKCYAVDKTGIVTDDMFEIIEINKKEAVLRGGAVPDQTVNIERVNKQCTKVN